ncbi:hypothetical protein QN277_014990 [Acacia crassicarpa]|uniref:Uncharacterized protein n=1 Tax=Acacia crassicarpa TaxID=499986 RepID=A0AAE1MV89_9FABA|nr:hypothetical protein QN277_014990 [Acacia crassicarpa]
MIFWIMVKEKTEEKRNDVVTQNVLVLRRQGWRGGYFATTPGTDVRCWTLLKSSTFGFRRKEDVPHILNYLRHDFLSRTSVFIEGSRK